MTKRPELQHSLRIDHATASQTKTWIDPELVGSEFRDARVRQASQKAFRAVSDGLGESIPLVCQDWANTKAAYRFLSNHRLLVLAATSTNISLIRVDPISETALFLYVAEG